uniref:Uncharacterized protein n=1 Tax=Bracon brevicornis TaxID=1563983 RepID=A0A6V7M6U4_9HYME
MDDNERHKATSPRSSCSSSSGGCTRSIAQPTTPTSPTLNLMEQLLLAKMERHSIADNYQPDQYQSARPKKTLLFRTDSMDSQTSASTFSSARSADSLGNNYCKCDDCLLGIGDKHQRHAVSAGKKKVNN